MATLTSANLATPFEVRKVINFLFTRVPVTSVLALALTYVLAVVIQFSTSD